MLLCTLMTSSSLTGVSEETHLETLEEVLSQLEKAGLRFKREKCEFMTPPVMYLGHKIKLDYIHSRIRSKQSTKHQSPNQSQS